MSEIKQDEMQGGKLLSSKQAWMHASVTPSIAYHISKISQRPRDLLQAQALVKASSSASQEINNKIHAVQARLSDFGTAGDSMRVRHLDGAC